jgi:hypothetical protein
MESKDILIVLFNLKEGIMEADYERFANDIDSPLIRRLPSNQSFKILKASGLLGSSTPSPFRYIEVMEVTSFGALAIDIKNSEVQQMLQQFSTFADNPQLISSRQIN